MIITNIVSLKLRKLNAEYRALYNKVQNLQRTKNDLELELIKIERQVFETNRKLDKLEEEIVNDLEMWQK